MRADTAGGPVRWANTHELTSTLPTGDLFIQQEQVVLALEAFHRALLNRAFYVESLTLSSVAEDGQPYNPEAFYTRTSMFRGLRGDNVTPGTLLPLANVLHVKKAVTAGREGNLLLRGFLVEEDIQSDPMTGAVTLSDFPGVQTEIATAWGELVGDLEGAGAKMVLMKVAGGVASQIRTVTGILPKGVTNKKLNNKYFDRASGGLGGLFDGLVEEYGPTVVAQIVQYLISSGGTVPPLLP